MSIELKQAAQQTLESLEICHRKFAQVITALRAALAQQPKPQPMTDAPEIVERVMRYAGKTIREARNPCITARETIVLADWLASHGITSDKEPCHARQKA